MRPQPETEPGSALAAELRRRIGQRRFLAERTIELGNAAKWTELSSGVLMTCRPDSPQSSLDGLHPMGDSSLTRLMEANDPADTLARCDAELAILDDHTTAPWHPDRCARCRTWVSTAPQPWPCTTVRCLAAAYRVHVPLVFTRGTDRADQLIAGHADGPPPPGGDDGPPQ